MNFFKIAFTLILCNSGLLAQKIPVWEIGTKWTYELLHRGGDVSFVTNEIVDTITIDSLELYVVDAYPIQTGIEYFYFDDGRVYSYMEEEKYLHLLYDFNTSEEYSTNYQPICAEYFNYDSLLYKSYSVNIDSSITYEMPGGQFSVIDYTSIIDTSVHDLDTIIYLASQRAILNGIGFTSGGQAHTHDWELGREFCDVWDYAVGDIRCFESKDSNYNFKGYPCDTTWFRTNVEELRPSEQSPVVFPNPAYGTIYITGQEKELEYRILDANGQLIDRGKTNQKQIELTNEGIHIIQLYTKDGWRSHNIVNLKKAR